MKKATRDAPETYEWLMARTRFGRRIERLSWTRLARMYHANRPARASQRSAASQSSNSKIRRAINAEARRLGYTPSTILALHAE